MHNRIVLVVIVVIAWFDSLLPNCYFQIGLQQNLVTEMFVNLFDDKHWDFLNLIK